MHMHAIRACLLCAGKMPNIQRRGNRPISTRYPFCCYSYRASPDQPTVREATGLRYDDAGGIQQLNTLPIAIVPVAQSTVFFTSLGGGGWPKTHSMAVYLASGWIEYPRLSAATAWIVFVDR